MTARQAGEAEAEGLRTQSGWRGSRGSRRSSAAGMGSLKDELLKGIWHAFTALDLDHSGKVSKSQLKVGTPSPGPLFAPPRRALYYPRVEAGRRTVTTGSGRPECGQAACLGWRGQRPAFTFFGLPLVLR